MIFFFGLCSSSPLYVFRSRAVFKFFFLSSFIPMTKDCPGRVGGELRWGLSPGVSFVHTSSNNLWKLWKTIYVKRGRLVVSVLISCESCFTRFVFFCFDYGGIFEFHWSFLPCVLVFLLFFLNFHSVSSAFMESWIKLLISWFTNNLWVHLHYQVINGIQLHFAYQMR